MLLIAFIIALAVIQVSAAKPAACVGTFCTNVKEVMYVNGTISSSQQYNLCMDVTTLNWKQTKPDGSWTMLDTPNNKLYSINARGKCSSTVPSGVANPSQMPFSMMDIDQAAHMDGKGSSPDSSIESIKYYHNRPSETSNGVTMPAEQMYWYVTANDDDTYTMVESVCGQVDPNNPTVTQSGNRDFSSSYDTKAGGDPATYTIPSDMDCTEKSSPSSVAFAALF
jgi:hypothetical protein